MRGLLLVFLIFSAGGNSILGLTKKYSLILICLLVLTIPPLVQAETAEEYSMPELLGLQLEELANIKVTVASAEPELIIETPAIVSRYDMETLSSMGLRTLRDALSFIPGVVLQDHLFGQTIVMMRGVYEGFNQKVLFLVDGVPYFMPSHSEIPLSGIPLEAISHIEVIRGPGAVFYGTNATAGVINVITKKDTSKSRIAASYGSNDKLNGGAIINHTFNEDLGCSLAFESQTDHGYDARYPAYPGFAEGTINKKDEMDSVLAKFRYKKANVLAQAFQSETNGLENPRQVNNVNTNEYEGYLLHADYGDTTGGDLDWKLFTDYNNFFLNFTVEDQINGDTPGGTRFNDGGDNNYRWRSGSSLNYHWSKVLAVFAGLEYEERYTGEYQAYNGATGETRGVIVPHFGLSEWSFYSQIDYILGAKWRFFVGGRLTDNSITGTDSVPRLGAVYKIDDLQSLKLLYSVGFNSPSFTQLRADLLPLVQGNPDLSPEKIKTVDLAYSYSKGNNFFVANVFYLKAENFIVSDRSSGTIKFYNASDFERYGAELDYQGILAKQWTLFANLAYHVQGNSMEEDDPTAIYAPKFTTALGVNYTFLKRHSIGASLRTISHRADSDALAQFNLDYQYKLEGLTLFSTLRNILDEEILHPNIGEFSSREVPGGEGFNFIVGAKYGF
jgi:outer membrane receptor protein involved in Fe transport